MAKTKEAQQRLEQLQAARTETLEEIAKVESQIAGLDAKREAIEGEAGDPLSRRRISESVSELGEAINKAASLRRVRQALGQRQAAIEREIETALGELHRAEAHKGHLAERKHFERDLLPKVKAVLASLEQLEAIQREIVSNHSQPRAAIRDDFRRWLEHVIKAGESGTPFASWADWNDAA